MRAYLSNRKVKMPTKIAISDYHTMERTIGLFDDHL